MSHATLTADIEDWLIGKALADPDVHALFEKLCERLRAVGLPLDRGALSWPTLHPLFRAEQVFWYPGAGAHLEQYAHTGGPTEHWLKSPFHHAHVKGLSHLRRKLSGPGALLDFEVLETFKDKGFTDYLLTATEFRIANAEHFSGGKTGIMASWMTDRDSGFSDDDLEALRRIQRVFAVACRASIQRRIMGNLADAYLGPTAGRKVLSGDIRLGDGSVLPAVVWYSDLRGSTRLSNAMDPQDYLALLNRYFECTAGSVLAHGGEILNFIGDGVLAIFPIHAKCPMEAAAKAESAAREALARQSALDVDGSTPGQAPLRFGIGLAVGEVMFGNIGVPERLAFSGIGEVVNTVTRVEAATKTLDVPVLALKSYADAAPAGWSIAGTIGLTGVDGATDVYAMDDLIKMGDSAVPARTAAE